MSTPILICCKLSPKKNSCIHTLKNKVDVPIDVHQVISTFSPCYLVGLLWPSMCCPIAYHIYPICFAQMYACLAYIMGPIHYQYTILFHMFCPKRFACLSSIMGPNTLLVLWHGLTSWKFNIFGNCICNYSGSFLKELNWTWETSPTNYMCNIRVFQCLSTLILSIVWAYFW
jgi:hypothetical protein